MIRYPNMKKPFETKKQSVANRGQTMESLVDESNLYYLAHQMAVVHKKPTPIQIVKVDYPSRQAAKIVEAYYKTPSTTDYQGVYQGYALDFDVKETRSKSSFPLKNIPAHQINHLKAVYDQGGVAFLIIAFTMLDEYFLLPFEVLWRYIERAKEGRQSMTYEECVAEAYPIKQGYRPTLPYLEAVKRYIEQVKKTP